MKIQPWKYRGLWLSVLAVLIIVLLGILSGAGYVLVVWLGWQYQTTATLFMLLTLAIIVGMVYFIRLINRWVRNWYVRHPRHVHDYQQLAPFEQLGCLWLLNAKTTKQQDLQQIFNQSASLKQLVSAHLLRENGQYEQAWQVLEQGSSLVDLLVLEKAELYIAQQRHQEALDQLLLIAQQPESSFVQSLNPAWQQHVQHLWANLAQDAPWLVLPITQRPNFNAEQQLLWLVSVQQNLAQASSEQQTALFALYLNHSPDLFDDFLVAKQWLLLLNAISLDESSTLIQQRINLADELLKRQFDPSILAIWLQDQRQQENLDCEYFIQRLEVLAQSYPGQPSIALAQWHQLKSSQQHEAAQQILQKWQQHPYFSYIRLTEALAEQPELLADLDIIYQVNNL